jgi:hypothetical protein
MASSAGLPRLDGLAAGSNATLSPQQWALYHDVQKWLTRQRTQLGPNSHMELANPRPTLLGIACDIRKLVGMDDAIHQLFKNYNPLCGTVQCAYDDAMKGNVYTVMLATNANLATAEGSGGGGDSGSGAQGVIGKILDEPKALLTLILAVSLCAAFTTSGQSWLKMANGLYALLNLGPSHP